jgi:hypothetical protein
MFYDTNYTRTTEIELYTDPSSTVGYGGYIKGKWMRINRIINTHFERPLFTIYTMASLSHKNEMRLKILYLLSREQLLIGSLTYVKIDDAIKVIRELGRFSLCSKFDIESAFRQLGIRKDQGHLFCIKCIVYFYIRQRTFFSLKTNLSPRFICFAIIYRSKT